MIKELQLHEHISSQYNNEKKFRPNVGQIFLTYITWRFSLHYTGTLTELHVHLTQKNVTYLLPREVNTEGSGDSFPAQCLPPTCHQWLLEKKRVG